MTDAASARAVRSEDAFDVEALARWLSGHGIEGIPEVTQFPGGASNLTYLLQYDDQQLVLRRPPAGHKAKSAHDMHREYRIQTQLRPLFPYVPETLAFCADPSVIGTEFYVMQRLQGTILRANLPSGFDLSPEEAGTLCHRMVDVLVELHQVDPAAADLVDLGRGPGYVRRQVEGWCDRYTRARTFNVPKMTRVMDWLKANQPDDVGSCVIHNDFRFDNLVLSGGRSPSIVGVLDWEMATIGDPLMDLGSALAYWVQADDDPVMRHFRRQPTHLPGMLTRRQVVDAYCGRMGLSSDDWAFYEVFGLFRLAVIVQQIYYRYHRKQTTNPAFKRFWVMVNYLGWRCRRMIAA